MYIEDLIITASLFVHSINKWDRNVIFSLHDQIIKGLGFTEKQKNLALKLLTNNSSKISQYLNKDITAFINQPSYKLSGRQITSQKLLSITSHSTFEIAIRAEFPYDDDIIGQIKKHKQTFHNVIWDADEKSWFFELSEQNILFALDLHNKFSFKIDDKLEKYKIQIENITRNVENYVPMISYIDEKFVYVNTNNNLPENTETAILPALFEARKKGIFTWDEHVSNLIENKNINPLTREFLKSSDQQKFLVNHEKYTLDDLKDIIFYLTPVLLIIPGGSEFQKINEAYKFFKNIGFENEQISVMFRLPNDTGNNFNEFIKNNNLNGSINETTKVVIISTKIPKPIIKSKIKFHSILNLGFSSVHYTIRDYIEKHENLIFYHNKSQQTEFNFGNM